MSAVKLHPASALGSFAGHTVRRLAGVLATAASEWQARRDMRALGGFDDAMLHDLGMDRGAIEDAVRHGRTRSC